MNLPLTLFILLAVANCGSWPSQSQNQYFPASGQGQNGIIYLVDNGKYIGYAFPRPSSNGFGYNNQQYIVADVMGKIVADGPKAFDDNAAPSEEEYKTLSNFENNTSVQKADNLVRRVAPELSNSNLTNVESMLVHGGVNFKLVY